MNLADVFTFLFVILGLVIVFVAYWLGTAGLLPGVTERCAERLGRSPIKATLVGLAVWLPVLFIGTAISNKAPYAPLKLVGLVLLMVSALVALAGSSGLAWRIGKGLPSSRDAQEPWRRVLRGGITLALTFVLPFVGWLVLAWALVAGFGAMILGRPKHAVLVAPEIGLAVAPGAVPVTAGPAQTEAA